MAATHRLWPKGLFCCYIDMWTFRLLFGVFLQRPRGLFPVRIPVFCDGDTPGCTSLLLCLKTIVHLLHFVVGKIGGFCLCLSLHLSCTVWLLASRLLLCHMKAPLLSGSDVFNIPPPGQEKGRNAPQKPRRRARAGNRRDGKKREFLPYSSLCMGM